MTEISIVSKQIAQAAWGWFFAFILVFLCAIWILKDIDMALCYSVAFSAASQPLLWTMYARKLKKAGHASVRAVRIDRSED